MVKQKESTELEKLLIQISLRVAKLGFGSLLIIQRKKLRYVFLQEQDVKFNIFDEDKQRRFIHLLSIMDGACVFDESGNIIATSAKIMNTKTVKGFGTRHAASYTASLNGNTSILTSEEDRNVKVYEKGVIVLQYNPFEKGIESQVDSTVDIIEKNKPKLNLLQSLGAGVLTFGAIPVITNAVSGRFADVGSLLVSYIQIVPGVSAPAALILIWNERKKNRKIKIIIGSIIIVFGFTLAYLPVFNYHLWFGFVMIAIGIAIALIRKKEVIKK